MKLRTNQMSGNEWKLKSDSRKDIEKKIEKLAKVYVPEWKFDVQNPDIGSVVGMIFAGQMSDNIERYNQVLDKYHTEFINMLGISLLPAKAASAIVLMELVEDTLPGIDVRKGTRLLAETEGAQEELIFETMHNLHITNSNLSYVFMTKGSDGKIIPLKGSFESPELVDKTEEKEPEENENVLKKFRLFGSEEKGIEKNALLFYHPVILDVENDNIYIKLTGNEQLSAGIKAGKYSFHYYTAEGLLPVEHVEVLDEEGLILIKKQKECAKITLEHEEYSLLALIANEPVKESIAVKEIAAASSGKAVEIEYVNNGITDFSVNDFKPFGDTLSLFQECYFGHDSYFSKAEAVVRIEFDVNFEEHRILAEPVEEEEELKIIKRKPKNAWNIQPANVYAEEISLEYYNGVGWKQLNCKQEVTRFFADRNAGKYVIEFVCPGDWTASGAGAYYGRCIRMQLLKADNCYFRPSVHFYPRIRNMKVSYSYENNYREPSKLMAVMGTVKKDLTKQLKEGGPVTIFSPGIYNQDAIYLGFSKKFESGPISILFQLEDEIRFEGTRCRFEYSTSKGFQQMKVLDYTMDMSRSGIIMFMPQADMQAMTLENRKAFWIRITPIEDKTKDKDEMLPIVKDIKPNAVQVNNIETKEEQDFFLDEVETNLIVPLGIDHVLDVELWVNEKNSFSRSQMQEMIETQPDLVRAEYDIYGEISAFYVKWQETDQLDSPSSKRCYVLDRMNNSICFGDGIRSYIPKVVDDVAFRAVIRRCDGQAGNVGAGKINSAMGNLMFVDRIYNPIKAFGGTDVESLENALHRGANILHSRRRLVSMEDYKREILSFSDSIDKVKCVTGHTIRGEKDQNAVSFIILLKDYAAGSLSFHGIASTLKKHLLEACELTIAPKDLHIVEPVFVKISVDVWAEVLHMDDSFEIQNILQDILEQYLNPISNSHGVGWEIGIIPKRAQLLMKLNVLKKKALIKKMVVTAKYTDYTGEHEVDLEDLKENPFFVCTSGKHRVNIMILER